MLIKSLNFIKRVTIKVILLIGLITLGHSFVEYLKSIEVTYTIVVKEFDEKNRLDFIIYNLVLDIADSNDTVEVFIDSYGGRTDYATNLIHHVRESYATVHTITDHKALSAGAILLMTGDKITATPDAIILFHRPYMGVGYGMKLMAPDSRDLNTINDLMLNRVFPIFTPEERQAYIDGKCIVLRGSELIKRLKQTSRLGQWPVLQMPYMFVPLNFGEG